MVTITPYLLQNHMMAVFISITILTIQWSPWRMKVLDQIHEHLQRLHNSSDIWDQLPPTQQPRASYSHRYITLNDAPHTRIHWIHSKNLYKISKSVSYRSKNAKDGNAIVETSVLHDRPINIITNIHFWNKNYWKATPATLSATKQQRGTA